MLGIIQNIKNRFPDDSLVIFKAATLFDPAVYSDDDCYGEEEVKVIIHILLF